MNEIARGACLCGAVTFELTLPSKWCAHCHCSQCRRAHGAAFVTWLGMAQERVRIVTGAEVLREHASSAPARRSFCGECGASLFFRSTRWPDEIHVALGCVLDPVDRAPAAHVFVDDRAPWVILADGLPHLGGATGTEPIVAK